MGGGYSKVRWATSNALKNERTTGPAAPKSRRAEFLREDGLLCASIMHVFRIGGIIATAPKIGGDE